MQYANIAKPFDAGRDLVVIPPTTGTGSEMSDGAILDPEFTSDMPASLTAVTLSSLHK